MRKINRVRQNNGLRALRWDKQMGYVARRHARQMATNNSVYHDGNMGSEITRWRRLAQNTGAGRNCKSLFRSFMRSPSHRANILGTWRFMAVGIDYRGSPQATRWDAIVYLLRAVCLRCPECGRSPVFVPLRRTRSWRDWATPLDGCLCRRFPAAVAWEEFAGRGATGQLATQLADVMLRTADALAARRLPAMLARPLAALAMQDVIDRARPGHFDDWLAVAFAARDLRDDRFDDFIATLTVAGPLVPVAKGSR